MPYLPVSPFDKLRVTSAHHLPVSPFDKLRVTLLTGRHGGK